MQFTYKQKIIGGSIITLFIIVVLILVLIDDSVDGIINNKKYTDALKRNFITIDKNNIKISVDEIDLKENIYISTKPFKGPKLLFTEKDTSLYLEYNVKLSTTTVSGEITLHTGFHLLQQNIEDTCSVVIDGTIQSNQREVFIYSVDNTKSTIGYISATEDTTIGISFNSESFTIEFLGSSSLDGTISKQTNTQPYLHNTLYMNNNTKEITRSVYFGTAFKNVDTESNNIITINTGHNDFAYRSAKDGKYIYTFSGRKL